MKHIRLSLIRLVVLFGVFSLAGISWYKSALNPINPDNQSTVRLVIPKGANSESIGKLLVEKNLIQSEIAFKLFLAINQLSRQLQAGNFNLSQNMSTPQIITALTKGTDDVWITVLEGLRREEIAQSLEKSINDKGGNFNTTTFLELTKNKEGYLFPDTYLVPTAISEEDIVSLLENTLQQKIAPELPNIENSTRSLHQILTMASIIEREAKTSESRKVVSGILWKRIDNDWPLQVDATLQYIKGYSQVEDTWWPAPRAVDKELESPFNTYKYPGLPPAPISTASLDSIVAAINPTPSQYWYYITGNDGQMYYAATFEEHNQNIQSYLR